MLFKVGNVVNLNRHLTKETRAKISAANKGRPFSKEHRIKLSIAARHRPPISEKTRANLSLSHTGLPQTNEKREKLRILKLGKARPDMVGNQLGWRGGRTVSSEGYVLVMKKGHPFANKDGYVPEHRLIMENIIGRILLRSECVHHRNGIKDDNRPENLEIVAPTNHYGNVICPHCQKHFLIH